MSDGRSKRKQRSGTGEDEDEVEIHSDSADDEVKQTTAARPTVVSTPPKRNRSENYSGYSQETFVQKLDGTCTSPQGAGLDVGRASVPVTAAGRTRCVRGRSMERTSPRKRWQPFTTYCSQGRCPPTQPTGRPWSAPLADFTGPSSL